MRYRRALGLTLMEVLVAVTVIAVVAAVVFVGLRAWRGQSLQVACMEKLSRVNEALMVYRTEWGNPHEVVGSTVYLGLPLQTIQARMPIGNSSVVVTDYGLSPWLVPQFGRTEKERYEIFTCPLLRRLYPETYISYTYWPELRWFADEEGGLFPYSSATAVLLGSTPVVTCPSHYSPETVWMDRSETYPLLVLSVDGRVKLEFISGFLVLPGQQHAPYFYDEMEYLAYLRRGNPEGFEREMKALQARRQGRR